MTERKVFGIVKFTEALLCAADSLGQTVKISLAKQAGTLTLPSFPEWSDHKKDLLDKILLAPPPAKNWKQGEGALYWGQPISYPDRTSEVVLALIEFSLASEDIDTSTKEIYAAFKPWIWLFEQYVKLLTKQNTRNRSSCNGGLGNLELLLDEASSLKHISSIDPITITVDICGDDESLHIEQLRKVAQLASSGHLPRLQYRMLLEAYSARRNMDFRKAIIEGATALEICLTERIQKEFDSLHISFGDKLLKKFRMLGGRFELIRMIGVSLPEKDYETLVINPRNDVIHRTAFPNEAQVNQFITEVEALLSLLTPEITEI